MISGSDVLRNGWEGKMLRAGKTDQGVAEKKWRASNCQLGKKRV